MCAIAQSGAGAQAFLFVILRKVVHVVRLSLARHQRTGGSLGGSLSNSLRTREKSLFVSPPNLFNPTASIFTHQTPRDIPHIPHDPAPNFPLAQIPASSSPVASPSRNSKPYLDVRFRLGRGYASHKTHTHHPRAAGASRCVFSSRQSLRRFTRASIRILVLVQRTVRCNA